MNIKLHIHVPPHNPTLTQQTAAIKDDNLMSTFDGGGGEYARLWGNDKKRPPGGVSAAGRLFGGAVSVDPREEKSPI